jgi:hypothetical protein
VIPLAADSLGLPFVLLIAVGLVLWAGLIWVIFPSIGRFIGRLIHRRDRAFVDQGRERVGITSITSIVEERERRANRALLAQRERWGRSG